MIVVRKKDSVPSEIYTQHMLLERVNSFNFFEYYVSFTHDRDIPNKDNQLLKMKTQKTHLDIWLAVHHSITLVLLPT